MARSKDRSEIEYYKGEIRKLKAEVKNLRRQLAENKRYIPDLDQFEEEAEEIVEISNRCPECKSGKLKEIDLNIKVLVKCDSCGFVRTRKK